MAFIAILAAFSIGKRYVPQEIAGKAIDRIYFGRFDFQPGNITLQNRNTIHFLPSIPCLEQKIPIKKRTGNPYRLFLPPSFKNFVSPLRRRAFCTDEEPLGNRAQVGIAIARGLAS